MKHIFQINLERNQTIGVLFDPLAKHHLNLLCVWLNKSHVKERWNDGLSNEEIKTKYLNRINDSKARSFIIYLEDKPIGFIQYYHADKVGNGWWPDAQNGTVGIDQFIGEEGYINQGYGTQLIKKFVEILFQNKHINKIITDVDPVNYRAIRCYEKVGFKFVKDIMTPEGPAKMLEIVRPISK